MDQTFSVAAIILAAGGSSRMGRPKMLLPWGGTTVLGHLWEVWSRSPVAEVTVVYPLGNPEIQAELDRLRVPAANRIGNPDPGRGMFSSIQCAAAWMGGSAELTHGAIALGDQPHLRSASLAALLEFARSHPGAICQPARRGRARHPVIIPAREFQNLAVSTLPNLREFLQSRAAICQAAELDDPGLEVDLDYPADYEEARCRFGDKAG